MESNVFLPYFGLVSFKSLIFYNSLNEIYYQNSLGHIIKFPASVITSSITTIKQMIAYCHWEFITFRDLELLQKNNLNLSYVWKINIGAEQKNQYSKNLFFDGIESWKK
jgi:hypothetical protein